MPNSFYVKMTNGRWLTPGADYVASFLTDPAIVKYLLIGLIAQAFAWLMLDRLTPDWKPMLLTLACFLVLVPFFLFVKPMMGSSYRFLYPTFCTIILGSWLTLLAAWPKASRTPRHRRLAPYLLFVVPLAVAATTLRGSAVALHQVLQDAPAYVSDPLDLYKQIGTRLNAIPNRQNIVMVYGDAGALPYYSHTRFIDVAGLNDTFIARARTEPERVLAYLFAQNPDLLFLVSDEQGNQPIGHHAFKDPFAIFTRPQFADHFDYLGTVLTATRPYPTFHTFVRKDSAYRQAIAEQLTPLFPIRHFVFRYGGREFVYDTPSE